MERSGRKAKTIRGGRPKKTEIPLQLQQCVSRNQTISKEPFSYVQGKYHGYGYSILPTYFAPVLSCTAMEEIFSPFPVPSIRTFQCKMTNRLSICTPTRRLPGKYFRGMSNTYPGRSAARFCRLPRCLWGDAWAAEKFENQAQRSGRLTASFFMPAKERGWMNARSS